MPVLLLSLLSLLLMLMLLLLRLILLSLLLILLLLLLLFCRASRVLSDRPTSHVCTVCATSNDPDVAYCRSCGASLKARVHS